MRIRTSAAAILATFTLALTSCGSSDGPKAGSESDPTPNQTSSSPSPSGPSTYKLGAQADFTADDGTSFNVTVLDYKKDQPDEDSVEDGERLDVLLVKACNVNFDDDPTDSDLGTNLDFENIQLGDDDSGAYSELDLTPSPAPKPQLVVFDIIGNGQCKKGWVAFAVPEATPIVAATYAGGGEVLARWTL